VARRASGLDEPGLHAWWVDGCGAADLSIGLGAGIVPGRIYAGQAGATRRPSGAPSDATLASRIRRQHLEGNVRGSTFRLTLASALSRTLALVAVGPRALAPGGEQRLSMWMRLHLGIAVFPYPDPDALRDLEAAVVGCLDPRLNLLGVAASSTRELVEAARRKLLHPGAVGEPADDGGAGPATPLQVRIGYVPSSSTASTIASTFSAETSFITVWTELTM
jgi:hypothetical protein